MADCKAVDIDQLEADLTEVADRIRAKGGTSASLAWPDGFKSAISAIETGGGGITPSGTVEITENGTYDVIDYASAEVALPEVTQATPTITVSSSGKITASVTQEAGLVAGGTKSATQQLTTQSGKTVTPGTSEQTAVASGRYTTGDVKVAGDSKLAAENIKSGVSIFGVLGTYTASGGDGSLPAGVSALATGEYTPAMDQSSTVSIEHGLGVMPSFMLLASEEDVPVAQDYYKYIFTWLGIMQAYNTSVKGFDMSKYGILVNSNYSLDCLSTNFTKTDLLATAYVFNISCGSSRMLKGGVTYRWIAGVIDGI